ncbi:MAG: hypothetical protein Kow0098_01090 [Ignavibacteriaceae bacterium]
MKKFLLLLMMGGLLFTGCDSTEPEDGTDNSDIPPDPQNVTIPLLQLNNIQPTATITPKADNPSRIEVNLQGMINPTTNNPIELYYDANNPSNSNIFIQEDGVVKGLKVTKVSSSNQLNADVVFTVDNSGSMSEEADSVAAGIIEFANFLQSSGLNVQFAIVGYDVNGDVSGAINFTNSLTIRDYLNRPLHFGTDRTVGFAGPDSAALDNKARLFAPEIFDENGVVAVLFADSTFAWRSGAQRVYINFTDEPTQHDGINWTTAQMCSLISGKATVHTVFSADTTSFSWDVDDERPWEMSLCTGGTIKFIPSDASGLNLKDLPFTTALTNSYLIEYIASSTGVTHSIIITIVESGADGKKEYTVIY